MPRNDARFEDSIKIVILSRGRSDTMTTHKILPMATLVCPESEAKDYEKFGLPIVTTPDDVIGMGRLRNWVLDNFKEEILVMVDDDVTGVRLVADLIGKEMRDPEIAYQLIVATAICAKDAGVGVFGWNQQWDVRKYRAEYPFRLNTWVSAVFGVIGRDIRFLDRNMFRVDIDFCLEHLLKKRIIWAENRFSFVQERDRNKGGGSLFRTEEKVQDEMNFLKRKWQAHYNVRKVKTTIITSINVQR